MGVVLLAYAAAAPDKYEKTPQPAPSAAYVISLAERLRSDYAVQDMGIDLMRAMRELRDDVNLPDHLREVESDFRDPTLTDEIERTVAAIQHADINCQVATVGRIQSDTVQSNSDLREHWTEATLDEAGRKIDGLHTMKLVIDGCVADGAGVSKLVVLDEEWAPVFGVDIDDYEDDDDIDDNPKAKSASQKYMQARDQAKAISSLPIADIPVDVRNWYPKWSGHRISAVVEITEREAVSTMNAYGVGWDNGSKSFLKNYGPPMQPGANPGCGPKLKSYEYWDDTWCVVVLQGAVGGGVSVVEYEHGMGRHPYFVAYGRMMSHWRMRKVGWGLGASKADLVRFQSFLQTLAIQEAARQVGKPVIRKRRNKAADMMGADGTPRATEQVPYSSILNWDKDDDVEPWPVESIGAALQQLITMNREAIERINTPRVTNEIGASGLEGAGFAMSQVLTEAQVKNWPYVDSLQQMLEQKTRFLWHLVTDVIGEKVYVHYSGQKDQKTGRRYAEWLGAGPEDLSPPVPVAWTISVAQPTGKIMELRYFEGMVNAGFMSQDQAIEAQGGSPSEVRRQRRLEEMRQEPWYKELEKQRILEELQRGDLVRQAAEAAAQSGVLPGMDPMQQLSMIANGQGMPEGGAGGVGDLAALSAARNGAGGGTAAPAPPMAAGDRMAAFGPQVPAPQVRMADQMRAASFRPMPQQVG